MAKLVSSNFPYGTFLANIIGCFLIGVFFAYFDKIGATNTSLKFFLITGICGGYTTFSSFSNENVQLLQNNQIGLALLYTALSILIGFTMTYLGILVTKNYI